MKSTARRSARSNKAMKATNKEARVHVRIAPQLLEAAQARAEAQGMTFSELVRFLLQAYVAEPPAGK